MLTAFRLHDCIVQHDLGHSTYNSLDLPIL
jgi:hypothetical protein